MLGTFIAGRYSGTYAGGSLGITQDGYHLRWRFHKDVIGQTDAYGRTVIEGFFLGAEVWVGGTFKEILTGVIASVSPYNTWAPTGVTAFELGVISRADTNVAATLVLSSTGGTPAASTPASLTAAAAIIDDGFDVEQLFGPTHRMTPFLYRFYPYLSSTVRFFSCT